MCGFTSGPQDNWLITQFINNTMRQAVIYIRVRYAINSQCEGGRGCLTTLDTYVFQTNTSDMSFTSNISNIFVTRPIAALTDTVRDGATIVTRILPVMADLSTTGLYVAFRDLGTCIALVEVTVFYPSVIPFWLMLVLTSQCWVSLVIPLLECVLLTWQSVSIHLKTVLLLHVH